MRRSRSHCTAGVICGAPLRSVVSRLTRRAKVNATLVRVGVVAMLFPMWSAAQTNPTPASKFETARGSKVHITVTSLASPLRFESQAISGYIEFAPAALTNATQIPLPCKVDTQVVVALTVGGFRSVQGDGSAANDLLDRKLQEALHKDKFPTIRYLLRECTLEEASGEDGPVRLVWKGDLTIAGTTNRVVTPVRMFYLSAGRVLFTGTASLSMYAFGLSPPELPASTFMNKVSPEVLVSFEWVVAKVR